ncbi:MAG: phosphotransferase [Anaerolineales bacterium]|nr:phosphotransferase [Anaerolineales bacterium]
MNSHRRSGWNRRLRGAAVILAGAGMIIFAAGCGGAMGPIKAVVATPKPGAAQAPTAKVAKSPPPTTFPSATSMFYPTPRATAFTTQEKPTSASGVLEVREERMLEVEWPPQMRLGESDALRLSLIPLREGYLVTAEFEEHTVRNNAVTVARLEGYSLWASARVDAAGFLLSPEGEQVRALPEGEPVTWRWTLTPRSAGRQRISLVLLLRWVPIESQTGPIRERELYSRSLTVNVLSFLGLTARQAAGAGFAGLGIGGAFSIPLTAYILRPKGKRLRSAAPNRRLIIELPAGLALAPAEQNLLRILFRAYARITLEAEFRSGYSGARTFLVLPVRADSRSDAYTIAKLGDSEAVRREYENYEAFVKDTLPPITARIQEVPVTDSTRARPGRPASAALRYTFIGEPGKKPVSLRSALLENPDPAYLERLFDTFGPGWWMQRKPYAFRALQEYDRALPAHFVLEPAPGRAEAVFDGRAAPADSAGAIGRTVRLKNFRCAEIRPGGKSLSLRGEPPPGQPALRVRWRSADYADGAVGRIVATRKTLLEELTAGLDLCGLPDPFAALENRLAERIRGTQSILHGDLNLENILAGPGGTVWLIDFAQTREGHTLADFAHLQAEIAAHVVAPALGDPCALAGLLQGKKPIPPVFRLMEAMESVAGRCLFNPAQPREYRLALFLSALGELKHTNLDPTQRNFLLVYAAHLQTQLA